MAKKMIKLILPLVFSSLLCFVSCTVNEHISGKKIKKNATEMMQCAVDKDAERLFSFFNDDMKNNYSEHTLKEIQQLFDYIDGNIVSYEYKGTGGSEENKHDGHIYYYSCYPKFEFTTDTNHEYTIEFSYHYIWDKYPQYEGVNMIFIRNGKDWETELLIGRQYYKK